MNDRSLYHWRVQDVSPKNVKDGSQYYIFVVSRPTKYNQGITLRISMNIHFSVFNAIQASKYELTKFQTMVSHNKL